MERQQLAVAHLAEEASAQEAHALPPPALVAEEAQAEKAAETKIRKRSPDEAAQALLAALGQREIQRKKDKAKPPETEIAPKQAQEGSKCSKGGKAMGKSSKGDKGSKVSKGSKGSKAPKTPGRLQIKPFR